MKRILFGRATVVLALFGFVAGMSVFAQKQSNTTPDGIKSQPGLVQFKMSQVVGYGMQGEWEFENNGTQTVFYSKSGEGQSVWVYTASPDGIQAVGVKNSDTLIANDTTLQIFGDPTLPSARFADMVALGAAVVNEINVYVYNANHIVTQHYSGDCWEVSDDGNTFNCSKTGEQGCTFSVELSTGKCYQHHVACPEEGDVSTGSVSTFVSNGITYFQTNIPRTRIDCDDM